MIVRKIEVSEICWMHTISWMIKEFAQLNELLYNHCIGTDFKKKKFAGIINPGEDTLNMWNQHQHHQGETQSQMHYCISIRLIAYIIHCICLFAYHYHVCVSFLDTLGSSFHEPRHASRSLLRVSKNCIMHSLEADGQQHNIFPHKIYIIHNPFHETLHCLCRHNSSMWHFSLEPTY